MIYYIYKIQFEDGHYYIGKHRTNNINDNYSGSGIKLKKIKNENPSIKWNKEILCFCENKGELQIKETEIVGTLFKSDKLCLNMIGGGGGCIGGFKRSEETKKKMSENNAMHNPENREKVSKALMGREFSEETKKKMSVAKTGQIPWNKGKKTGHIPWCKGLTKDTDERVNNLSKKVSNTRKENNITPWNKGKKTGQIPWNKGLNKENSDKVKTIGENISKNCKGRSAWNTGLPKENQPTYGKHWKSSKKYTWKINPETGKRVYTLKESSDL